jgi:hypothetical protein
MVSDDATSTRREINGIIPNKNNVKKSTLMLDQLEEIQGPIKYSLAYT